MKYQCPHCNKILDTEEDDDEIYTLRECSNDECGCIFIAEDGNNCPDCNRPFTRKLADVGCPDCEEEMILINNETSQQLKGKQMAKRGRPSKSDAADVATPRRRKKRTPKTACELTLSGETLSITFSLSDLWAELQQKLLKSISEQMGKPERKTRRKRVQPTQPPPPQQSSHQSK